VSDANYDGIIIGSGQHGLVLACYLAKAGLKVALVERRMQYGGGLMTEEVTVPGFVHNLHSINHWDLKGTPWYSDLELSARVPYVTPAYEFSQPHSDGTALVFARNLEETVASIGRFSTRDAETFREWNAKAELITRDVFVPERFSEPLSKEERTELLKRSAAGRDFLDLTGKQPYEIITTLFENERVQVFLLFKLSLFGTVLYDMIREESPTGSILRAFDIDIGYDMCVGGSWNLARGLMEVFIANGGDLRQPGAGGSHRRRRRARDRHRAGRRPRPASEPVRGLHRRRQPDLPADGRARSAPAEFNAKVADHHYTPWALYGVHLALNEAPRYTSTDFDPNVNRAMKQNIGSETLEQLMGVHKAVQDKTMPTEIQFGAGPLTMIDPTQAPPGKHTAYAWHVVPYDPGGDPANAEAVRESFGRQIIEKWREYAPNLTDDNILGVHFYTPNDYVAHLPNMRGGDIFMGAFTTDQVMWNHFGYRSPIAGLYNAGSAAHPGGAISGGAGYISARVICEGPRGHAMVDARRRQAGDRVLHGRPARRQGGMMTPRWRIATALLEGRPEVVVEHPGGGQPAQLPARGRGARDVRAFIAGRDGWEAALVQALASPAGGTLDPAELVWAPPLMPNKLICIGANYGAHNDEMLGEISSPFPYAFLKPPTTALIGHATPAPLPAHAEKIDYEVELAVVVGRLSRHVTRAEALDAVFGYAVLNDLSARDWVPAPTFLGLDWVMLKGFDASAPMGPWITPAQFAGDPDDLAIKLSVNGELRQDSRTSDMVFDVAGLIVHLSSVMTLEPGDVIATGTPAGVGFGRTPPSYLEVGDVVRAEIEGLGVLETPIAAALRTPEHATKGGIGT
jgi:2-keto-4-pentenoate hydratase/2-oxohepta-3-ene-1,7-dioic acid hydratase in catechol pathway/phytoene dehydrogenase-like protein